MDGHSQPRPREPGSAELKQTFRDLRRHNEYEAKVARMLQAKRQQRIEQSIKSPRTHQSR